jgi:cytochrome c oxidase cbb3-type subunit 3
MGVRVEPFQAIQTWWRLMTRRHSISVLAVVLLGFLSVLSRELRAQSDSAHSKSKSGSASGQQIFVSICAGCHGLDGQGAERAPNIARNPKLQQLSDARIGAIISNGVSGTAMPPFRSLGDATIKSVVSYLRTLEGKGATTLLPADAADGRSIFFGKAGCSHCHMAEETGGFLGADLSGYAGNHSLDEVRGAITDPAKNTDWQRVDLIAVTSDGQRISGIARNQDNFSLQLQTSDGEFHFLQKSQLRSLEHPAKPVMPSDYASTLTRQEIDHLVSYLMSLGAGKKHEHGHQDDQ